VGIANWFPDFGGLPAAALTMSTAQTNYINAALFSVKHMILTNGEPDRIRRLKPCTSGDVFLLLELGGIVLSTARFCDLVMGDPNLWRFCPPSRGTNSFDHAHCGSDFLAFGFARISRADCEEHSAN